MFKDLSPKGETMCLAIPGQVVELKKDRAKVALNGVLYDAGLALMDSLAVGDWVLLHAGYILEKLDRDEAEKELEAIREYTNLVDP